jgi:hypothetical protein
MTLSSSLASQLDLILPLFTLNIDIVDQILKLHTNIPIKWNEKPIPLRQYRIASKYVLETITHSKEYSPNLLKPLQLLFHQFESCISSSGGELLLLDMLSVLTIVCNGTIEQKARYLFDWYNVSQDGFMNELELGAMIHRVSGCFHNVLAMTTSDLAISSSNRNISNLSQTLDEAMHIAMKARVFTNSSGELKLKAGLRYPDFLHWISTSPDCAFFNQISSALSKLVLVVKSLQHRTIKLHDAIHNNTLEKACYPPPHKLESSRLRQYPVAPIFIMSTDTAISFVMVIAEDIEVYVKIQMLGNTSLRSEHMEIVDREFYRTISLGKLARRRCRGAVERIDIDELQPDRRYVLTTYTNQYIYDQVRASTKPDRFQPSSSSQV